jgi:succinate dehydrogenase / fumarate reductase, flavoprotein subunit
MSQYETHQYDVVVIGAGGAGLRAAIAAAEEGQQVAVVCKSLLGKAHTVMAEGGAAAALGHVAPEDCWQVHFQDTIKGGKTMNNWRMAQLHAQEAPDRIREMELYGAVFDRTEDGRILQRPFGGHTYPRLAHVGDRTGLELIRTLQDKAVHTRGIDIFMECTMTHLLKDGDAVSGCFGYRRDSGKFIAFNAKAIVLASGGVGKAFKITSNSWEYSGDGQVMAYEAGAELIDMEFIQFHPTGMVWPNGVAGLLVTEAVRGEGGFLTNNLGERFMKNYDPARMELSTRDIVAKAIYAEVKAGRGSKNGGVYLDISHRGADYVKRKLPSMYHQFKELGDVDITAGPMEVGPTTHYIMGGVKVDPETAETTVKGLYAAGEVAGGMHGANRLGGNSLTDLLVFGRRAGLAAAQRAKAMAFPSVNQADADNAAKEMLAPFESNGTENPYEVHLELQRLMQANVGIVRTETDLEAAITQLKGLKERAANVKVEGTTQFNTGWHLARDLRHLVTVSEAVARCALQRKESRGGHTRLDYEPYDPYWESVNSLVKREADGSMSVGVMEKPVMPDELKKLFEEPATQGAH